MTQKILFTDLDGTLLNNRQQISEKNKAAIEAALKKGHQIAIATGRPISSAKQIAKDLELVKPGCYVIASNGALLYDAYHDKVIKEKTFSKDYLRPLMDSAYEEGLHIHTYSHTNVLSERETKEIKWYEKAIRVPYLIVEDVTAYLPYDPIKCILIDFNGRSRLQAFQAKMADWASGKVDSIFSSDIMLEYCPLGVSKGNAVKDLCQLLQIPIENSVAAGDAENDISMIQAAGIGCAMCNGSPLTKESADYVTKLDNEQDGFAEIIEHFL